MRINQL